MSEKTERNQSEIKHQHYDINPEKLKQFKGFENITEDEALKICAFTVHYCSIIYESIIHSKTFKRDEQSNPRFSKVRQSKST